ncbi:pyridoxal phosphate-dependent transferase [Aspergillus aurantiobrunneus]
MLMQGRTFLSYSCEDIYTSQLEPIAAPSIPSTKETNGTNPQTRGLSIYRHLVPLLSNPSITYLNASFAPPSNLLVHAAINKFNTEALLSPAPKPGWLQTAEDVRALLAGYINADPTSIALTRDTTEGLNGFIPGLKSQPGDNMVILVSEHPHHAYAWMALCPTGLEVRQIPTIPESKTTGRVVTANAATFAPSIMFHSGQWNDLQGTCDVYRPRGIHVLADLTQQVGFAPVNVTEVNVSAASFTLHKGLNCPTGLAALYVHPDVIREVDPVPPVVGYGAVWDARADLLVPSDEIVYHPSARRYGHLNLSLVAAAAAKAYLDFYLDVMGPEHVESHLYRIGDALRTECQRLGVNIVGPEHGKKHAPHLYILDLHDGRWMEHFIEAGVYVTPYRLRIRVSFRFYNNLDDVQKLVAILESGIQAGIRI